MAASCFLLAVGGLIYGIARLGEPQKIKTKSEWRNLLKLHHWDTPEIPYKRGIAYAFRIEAVHQLPEPVPYETRQGQFGCAIYRPLAEPAAASTAVVAEAADNSTEESAVGEPETPTHVAAAPKRRFRALRAARFFDIQTAADSEDADQDDDDPSEVGSLVDFIVDENASEAGSASGHRAWDNRHE